MTDWWLSLEETLSTVWQRLARATKDRHAPLRFAALATIGVDGAPAVRTIVLRRAARTSNEIDIYTDLHSAKVAEISAVPQVSLLGWDPKAHLQVRVAARAAVLSGDAVADHWTNLPEAARADYGAVPPPGTAIAAPGPKELTDDASAFAVIRCHVMSIETVYLGRDLHCRAIFERDNAWVGQWLQP